jgi:signal transduction histidine kinase
VASAFAIVDGSLPEAIPALEWLSARERGTFTLALLGPRDREYPFMRLGARATLRSPVFGEDLAGMLGMLKRAEEEHVAAKALFGTSDPGPENSRKAAEQAYGALVHEIRNPLTVARGNVEILRDSTSHDAPRVSGEERDEMMTEIQEALRRIDDITETMGTLVRGDPPSLAPIDLLAIAQEAVALLRHPGTVSLRVEGVPGIVALANRGLLLQVLANLLRNALEAVFDVVARPVITVRVYGRRGEMRISVRDNGPGIPLAMRGRLFEPFFSTKGSAGTCACQPPTSWKRRTV